ncbi:MAG TPA: tetratricopeptide repeat protein [Spirochaetia bacterium]|nr:tetratricopeptide repeat protein [Spirochaetales bacterium]HRS64804.1 tetratricopeptide repeat protein [Spirochaetia bacterium]HOT59867.1 tetratricopeptide repeat protein [Spirochaetales bacterium]HPD79469.1 tetratricopeptide repeat protein [Spirochaetales bacterium]HQK33122.1 tetratricopeptide repeat protein [Spirochaetales bacterium]
MRKIFITLVVFALLLSVATAQTKPDALKLYREGKYEEARQVCLLELEQNPSNMDSYVVLCWSLLALKRWGDAELYAKKALAIRNDPRVIEILGEAAFYMGKNKEALEYFTQYINLLPDGSRIGVVYYFIGEIYIRQEKLQHASIAMSTALLYDASNVLWWTRLGYIYERLKDYQNAVTAYSKALELNPLYIDAKQGKDRILALLRE